MDGVGGPSYRYENGNDHDEEEAIITEEAAVAAVAAGAVDTEESSSSSLRVSSALSISSVSIMQRRGSMSEMEQKERRASIKAIMADTSRTPMERRRSIQFLMDGRRNSMGNTTTTATTTATATIFKFDHQQQGERGDEDEDPRARKSTKRTNSLPDCISRKMPSSSTTTITRRNSILRFSSSPKKYQQYGQHNAIPSFDSNKRAELSRPHCSHYNRNCSIVSPCCSVVFGCRICHDECPILPPKNNNDCRNIQSEMGCTSTSGGGAYGTARRKYRRSSSMPASFASLDDDDHSTTTTTTTMTHTIDRFAIKEVICRKCHTRQTSKTNKCLECGIKFGEYHCAICNLWMDSTERPYHCPDCGFCCVGGKA